MLRIARALDERRVLRRARGRCVSRARKRGKQKLFELPLHEKWSEQCKARQSTSDALLE